MTKKRREFTPEFKREAVALLESSGRPQMQIAAELGIQPSMLRNWRAVLNGGAPRSRTTAKAAPVARRRSHPLLTRRRRSHGCGASSTARAWSATC